MDTGGAGEKGNPKLQCMSYDEFGNEVKNRKDNFEENAMAEVQV
jgi:hypothetical protein